MTERCFLIWAFTFEIRRKQGTLAVHTMTTDCDPYDDNWLRSLRCRDVVFIGTRAYWNPRLSTVEPMLSTIPPLPLLERKRYIFHPSFWALGLFATGTSGCY